MFERFSQDARAVVHHAVGLAEESADEVRVEHLLAGVAAVEHAPAARVLANLGATRARLEEAIDRGESDRRLLQRLGIDLDQVRTAVTVSFGPDAWRGALRKEGHVPFSSPAKKALELSLRQAIKLGSKTIYPGHILLGLMMERSGPVVEVLGSLGIGAKEVERRLLAELDAAS